MVKKTAMSSLLALSCAVVAPFAGAQQLNQPKPVQMFKSSDADSSGSQQLAPPTPRAAGSVRSDAGQRATTPPVSPTGPATDATRPTQPVSITPTTPTAPVRVVDAQGRLVPGAVQVGNNQVMDPKTGRIYTTTPAGDGQRIVTPTQP